jgi:hypothetical protein
MTTAATGPAKTAAAKKTAAAPAAPTMAKAPTGATAAPGASQMQQQIQILADADVSNPVGLHAFLEAMRQVNTMLAFYTEAAGTQLDLAMRRGTRDSADGRLTLQQKVEMRSVLRRVTRGMGNVRDDLLNSARDAVVTYSHMESFLESLESSQVSRPHRSTWGGFDPFGGR